MQRFARPMRWTQKSYGQPNHRMRMTQRTTTARASRTMPTSRERRSQAAVLPATPPQVDFSASVLPPAQAAALQPPASSGQLAAVVSAAAVAASSVLVASSLLQPRLHQVVPASSASEPAALHLGALVVLLAVSSGRAREAAFLVLAQQAAAASLVPALPLPQQPPQSAIRRPLGPPSSALVGAHQQAVDQLQLNQQLLLEASQQRKAPVEALSSSLELRLLRPVQRRHPLAASLVALAKLWSQMQAQGLPLPAASSAPLAQPPAAPLALRHRVEVQSSHLALAAGRLRQLLRAFLLVAALQSLAAALLPRAQAPRRALLLPAVDCSVLGTPHLLPHLQSRLRQGRAQAAASLVDSHQAAASSTRRPAVHRVAVAASSARVRGPPAAAFLVKAQGLASLVDKVHQVVVAAFSVARVPVHLAAAFLAARALVPAFLVGRALGAPWQLQAQAVVFLEGKSSARRRLHRAREEASSAVKVVPVAASSALPAPVLLQHRAVALSSSLAGVHQLPHRRQHQPSQLPASLGHPSSRSALRPAPAAAPRHSLARVLGASLGSRSLEALRVQAGASLGVSLRVAARLVGKAQVAASLVVRARILLGGCSARPLEEAFLEARRQLVVLSARVQAVAFSVASLRVSLKAQSSANHNNKVAVHSARALVAVSLASNPRRQVASLGAARAPVAACSARALASLVDLLRSSLVAPSEEQPPQLLALARRQRRLAPASSVVEVRHHRREALSEAFPVLDSQQVASASLQGRPSAVLLGGPLVAAPLEQVHRCSKELVGRSAQFNNQTLGAISLRRLDKPQLDEELSGQSEGPGHERGIGGLSGCEPRGKVPLSLTTLCHTCAHTCTHKPLGMCRCKYAQV
mmetsp:Transcript_106593/g.200779  ORF Transcript_106593/g.200779 Transcript_106593/m.200779 type:complete len:866 (+) Transcript_106593:550-3147(+)